MDIYCFKLGIFIDCMCRRLSFLIFLWCMDDSFHSRWRTRPPSSRQLHWVMDGYTFKWRSLPIRIFNQFHVDRNNIIGCWANTFRCPTDRYISFIRPHGRLCKNQVAFCCVCNSIRSIRGCGTSDHRVQGWWRHWIHCVVVDKDTNAPSGILILSSNYRVKFKSWTFATLPSECKSFLYVFWPNLLTCNMWALLFSKKEIDLNFCGSFAINKWLEERICSSSLDNETRGMLLNNRAPFRHID
jgi:hypothetical protein